MKKSSIVLLIFGLFTSVMLVHFIVWLRKVCAIHESSDVEYVDPHINVDDLFAKCIIE